MTDSIETPTTTPKPRAKAAAAKTVETPALPRDINSIIPLIREDLGAVGKDQSTESGTRYNYRGHDQIINAIVPLFNKYGVYTTVSDEPIHYEGRNAGTKYVTAVQLLKTVTFWAPDGTSRVSKILAESTDYSNKATGQAGTYAYRIAIEQTFSIPTGLPDPDSRADDQPATEEPVKAQPANAPAVSPDEINALKGQVKDLFAKRDVTEKEDILARGTKFFNGRAGWDAQPVALRKLIAALEAGEVVGE